MSRFVIPGGGKNGKLIFEFDSSTEPGLPIPVGDSIVIKTHLSLDRFQTLHVHVFTDVIVDLDVEWNDDPGIEDDWVSSTTFNIPVVSPSGVGIVASIRVLARHGRLRISNADLINPVTSLKFSAFAFPL